MYNINDVVSTIKGIAKESGKSTSKMLVELGLNKNTLSSMSSRGSWVKADTLAKIADYLDCSVDCLLGRDEKYIGCNNVSTGDIKDNHDVNINSNNNIPTAGELESEISSILSSLTTREKTELMGIIYNFVDERKKL